MTVCKGYDGAVTVLRDGRELPVELLAEGGEPPPVEDGKSVRSRVETAKARQQSRSAWKPPPDHPWRRLFGADAEGRPCAPEDGPLTPVRIDSSVSCASVAWQPPGVLVCVCGVW